MKVNNEIISIQNSCIPQGLSSNWDKLYNVQLIQKGLALRKVFIISKGTCKLQSVQQMYEIFPKTISWTFLLLKVKVSCQGDNGNVFQLKHSFLSIVWKVQQRGEIITDAHHIAQPPPQAFLGEIIFLPSPQKPQTCGEGRNTISPKNACGGGYTLPWQQNFSISTNHYPANMAGKKMTELTCMTFLCMIALRNKSVAHTIVLSFGNVNGSLSQERLLRSRNLAAMVT